MCNCSYITIKISMNQGLSSKYLEKLINEKEQSCMNQVENYRVKSNIVVSQTSSYRIRKD